MVKTFQAYLNNCHRTYSCIHCRAHLANHDELISKSFQGSQGRAYLFNSVVNVGCGQAEERVLLTGLHAVADIFCESCKTTLGWKYEHAFESSQKYKEGKYIIELAHMIKENGWEDWCPLSFTWTILSSCPVMITSCHQLKSFLRLYPVNCFLDKLTIASDRKASHFVSSSISPSRSTLNDWFISGLNLKLTKTKDDEVKN